jgi:hypothetical protein
VSPARIQALFGRPRALAALAVVLVLAIVLFARSCGGDDKGPATGAAKLVPADALAYVHVSTDADRTGYERAIDLLRQFPSLAPVSDSLFRRIFSAPPGFSFQRDVRPWLGKEAALALLNTTGEVAGSLIVVDVADRKKAEAFLVRASGRSATSRYRGTDIVQYGNVASAFIGRYLAIGQEASLERAIDDAAGRKASLAGAPTYRRVSSLPRGRFADAYVSVGGVRRLLAPQGGILGVLGVLLDQPRLLASGLSLEAADDGARITVRSALGGKGGRTFAPFEPQLAGSVPGEAMAYLGVTGLERAVTRLLAAGAAGGITGPTLTAALQRLRQELDRNSGVDVRRDILPLFQGEVALWLAPAIPAPTLTLIARAPNEQRVRDAFAKLQGPLARLFAAPQQGPGQAPTFEERELGGGKSAFSLRLAPGVEIDYAIFDGKLVVSTSLDGIRAVRANTSSISHNDDFRATVGDRPKRVTSLLFLDFHQLLRLGEQTGLSDSRSYLAIRDDLQRIRAIGAFATGSENDTKTEILLKIK